MRSRSVVAALLIIVGAGCADQLDVATSTSTADAAPDRSLRERAAALMGVGVEHTEVLTAPARLELAAERPIVVHPAQAATTLGFLGVPVFTGTGWALGTSTNAVTYPVQASGDDVLTGAVIYIRRTVAGAAVVAQMERVDNLTGLQTPLSSATVENSGTTGTIAVPLTFPAPVQVDGAWTAAVRIAGLGTAGVTTGNVAVDLGPPPSEARERWSSIQRGPTDRYISYDGGDLLHTTANDAFLTMPINNISVGEVFSSASIRLKGTGGNQIVQAHLIRSEGDGTSTILHTVYASNPPAVWATYKATWTPGPDDVAVLGKSYYWYFVLPLAGTFLGQTGYTTAPQ